MPLLIEDGTGVPGATSFASVAEARTFATARGFDLPAADEDVEPLLVKAGDFLLGVEHRFKGSRATTTQRLPFPRQNVTLYGSGGLLIQHGGENLYLSPGQTVPADAIPEQLKEAQIRLAIDANSVDLRPTGTGQGEVKRKKVGPLETEFFEGGRSGTPQFNAAFDLLAPLLKSRGVMTVSRG